MTDMGMTAPSTRAKRGWFGRWVRRLFWLGVSLLLLSVLQVAILRVLDPPTSSFMLIRQGQAFAQGQWQYRNTYQWRDYQGISPQLRRAVVAAEDQRFMQHRGFDMQAIADAHQRNQRGEQIRGGSTISQQVAKNLFLWNGRGIDRWLRKGLEAWYTVLIELLWPKQRILEVYLNIIELGDGLYGAQAAARHYWKVDADNLSASQAARLAAVLPNPKRYRVLDAGPYVQRRSRAIERQMRNLDDAAIP